MYPIYPGRITRNDVSNIKVFQKNCGEGGLSKVILATTRWNACPKANGESREKEVWSSFWNGRADPPLQERTMARLDNSPDSAGEVIETILGRMEDSGVVLSLQKQLVDKRKSLPQTDAAKELRAKILELLHESSTNGSEARKKRLEALAQEANELKIPFSKKLQGFFGIVSGYLLEIYPEA
jgi:hypothetical protein